MSISVKDILKLDIFSNAIESSGTSGLSKNVNGVSVIDCKIDEADITDSHIIREGDFFITNLYAVKDNPEDIVNLIDFLCKSGSSGLCIVNQYFEHLPSEAVEFANKNAFYIMLLDKNIPYGDIIRDIMEMLLQEKIDMIYEMKINRILELSGNEDEIRKTAYELNPDFEENIVAIFARKLSNQMAIYNIRKELCNMKTAVASVIKYENGLLIILSFHKNMLKHVDSQINYVLAQLDKVISGKEVGISRLYNNVRKMRACLVEALASANAADALKRPIVHYQDIGLYKLLIPLIDQPVLQEFCNEILTPLKDYDTRYNSSFFDTALSYIDCDGDFKRVAELMFQHENTIRNRIVKMQEILGFENRKNEFYIYLYVAIKSSHLLEHENTPFIM